ncbi:MAG: UDP-N-acetylglucosamine 2-epimerase (non-hydrolyzing) [Thermoguttaceae bacterium]|jgi:UDP-N-acetylglucosamine 2-epimerase (non-hydrolysing)
MKIATILGTRPEIIRLSRVIEKIDVSADHVVIHTGQNYDPNLNDIFFRDLGVRAPNYYLDAQGGNFGEQVGMILSRIEPVFQKERPDRVLILGDTNSGLTAFIAKRMGIPVYHMEAGNRCYDDRVPEEVNRRVIDHSSDVLMPYTERSRANLLREGIPGNRIFVTGNPILEVINYYNDRISASTALADLGVEKGRYFLVTMHRAENVDIEPRLRALTTALESLHRQYGYPILCSLHPRTRSKMTAFGLSTESDAVRFLQPLGFFDFIALEREAYCVLSDSGTVQEECCLFRVPNVTIRDVTERPETVECGSNMLSGADPAMILRATQIATGLPRQWTPPQEYLAEHVSATVLKIILGFNPDLSFSP